MKWIGQHIYDLVSRFRNDVYLEDIDTGTIASGGNLGLDSHNKIVKAAEATGTLPVANGGTGATSLTTDGVLFGNGTSAISAVDLSTAGSIVVGGSTPAAVTGATLAGVGLLSVVGDGALALNVEASQTQITSIGTIGTGKWQGTAIASAYLDADTAHLTTNQTFSGVKTFSDVVILDGDRNWAGEAGLLHLDSSTITDATTSASGTSAEYRTVNIEPMTVAATNASVTTTDAASLKIQGPPVAGTNMTLANQWALWVDSGNVRLDAGLKLDDVLLSSVQTSSEPFADNDTSIMTSAAIEDRINTKYSTSYITFSAKSTSSYGTNYIMPHANGISNVTFTQDSGIDSATDFGLVATEEGGTGTDETCDIASAHLEQQIPIAETCKLIGFYATTTTQTNTGSGYDTGVAIWHVPEANVDWGGSDAAEATLIHKSDSSRHTEGSNRKKVQKVHRMDGTIKSLAAGDILVPSLFGETSNQQIMATITLVIATPIKTI